VTGKDRRPDPIFWAISCGVILLMGAAPWSRVVEDAKAARPCAVV
jgi:hypothetical protein